MQLIFVVKEMKPSCLGSLIIMECPFLQNFGTLCRAVKTLLGKGRLTLKYTYLLYIYVLSTMAAVQKPEEVIYSRSLESEVWTNISIVM